MVFNRIQLDCSLQENSLKLSGWTEASNFFLTPARYIFKGKNVVYLQKKEEDGKLERYSFEKPSFSQKGQRSYLRAIFMFVTLPFSLLGLFMRSVDMTLPANVKSLNRSGKSQKELQELDSFLTQNNETNAIRTDLNVKLKSFLPSKSQKDPENHDGHFEFGKTVSMVSDQYNHLKSLESIVVNSLHYKKYIELFVSSNCDREISGLRLPIHIDSLGKVGQIKIVTNLTDVELKKLLLVQILDKNNMTYFVETL